MGFDSLALMPLNGRKPTVTQCAKFEKIISEHLERLGIEKIRDVLYAQGLVHSVADNPDDTTVNYIAPSRLNAMAEVLARIPDTKVDEPADKFILVNAAGVPASDAAQIKFRGQLEPHIKRIGIHAVVSLGLLRGYIHKTKSHDDGRVLQDHHYVRAIPNTVLSYLDALRCEPDSEEVFTKEPVRAAAKPKSPARNLNELEREVELLRAKVERLQAELVAANENTEIVNQVHEHRTNELIRSTIAAVMSQTAMPVCNLNLAAMATVWETHTLTMSHDTSTGVVTYRCRRITNEA